MSFKKIIFAVLCFICLYSSSQAKIKFTIAPEFGVMGGTTEYDMNIKAYFDTYGDIVSSGTWQLRSLLEFPLNTTIGGISTEIRSIEDPNKWSIELKYLTNLNNPTDKMLDSDWEGFSSLFPYTQFSYTESNVKMDMTILDAEFRFRISQKPNYDISIIAGGMYQKIYQDIFGIDGWQRRLNNDTTGFNSPFYFDTLQNSVVGTYEIINKQFKIGLQSDIYFSKKFTTQLKVAFAPASFKDTDDHVLRNKLSTGNGDGNGYLAGLNLKYNFSNSKLSFIQLSTSLNTYNANGTQTQWWYADETHIDPNTQEVIIDVPQGTTSPLLPHKVRTKQYSVSLQVGIEF